MSDEPKPYKPRCIYLTCKAMLTYGEDFEQDPDYQSGAMDFTCLRTCQISGPDGGETGLEVCSNPQRECFREFVELQKAES